MQTLIDGGIAIVIAIQNMGDWLLAPMKFFSELGTEQFFFLVLPLIYWSIDSALGIRVAFVVATSSVFNYVGKILFAGPRPYWVSSNVKAFSVEGTFGIPSGHAQNALGVWGTIATVRKEKWLQTICIFIIFMIGFSRIYLGVHFLHDVLAGWLLGALLLWLITKFWEPVQTWLAQKTFAQQAAIALGISVLFILIGLSALAFRSDFQLSQLWIDNSLLSSTETLAPLDPNGLFTATGSFFGLALGIAWINAKGGYQANGPIWKRALRYVIGLIGVLILWMGLGEIFPREADALSYILRFIRYTLVGWWVMGGAPWVFQHFNLTTSSTRTPSI